MRSLAASRPLIGLTLRRDRVKIAVWVLALALTLIWSAVEYKTVYPTAADLRGRAELIQGNAAAVALTGPAYGLGRPALGNVLANDTLGLMVVAVALMATFQVVRNTRGEEEDGRAELIAAGVVGRHARSASAFAVSLAACSAVGFLAALALMLSGLPVAGSVAYGLAVACGGAVFAAVALLSAQASRHGRVANAVAGVALAAAFALRAVGDIGGGTASWFSPIGWAQAIRPFAGERWWPLLLLAGATALVAAVGFRLEARRDLGAGLIADRPGPPEAAARLSNPLGLPLRQQRIAIASWAVGIFLGGFLYGTLGTSVDDLLAENPNVTQYLAQTGGSPVDSYFVTILGILALVATGFTIQSLTRLRGEETSGRAEILLATPLGRIRWAGGYLLVAVAGTFAVMLACGVGLATGYGVGGGAWGSLAELTGAALTWLPAMLVVGGLVALFFGLWPHAMPVAWAYVGWCFLLFVFGQTLDLPGWLIDSSPFTHVPPVPAESFSGGPLVALCAVAIGLGAVGLLALRRRDVS